MHKILKKILFTVRIFLILGVLILMFYLFLRDFAGNGVIIFKNDFSLIKDRQISDLYPHVRIKEKVQTSKGDWYQNVFIDPVYFKINPPREFDKARFRIKFRAQKQSLFAVGVKAGPGELDFDFETMGFLKLDNIDWHETREGETVLYQKYKRYNSISDFLGNLPKDGRIAFYNLELEDLDTEGYRTTILNQKTDLEHVSYILAKYKEPKVMDDWRVNEVEFDISQDNFYDGRLIFILSAPEIDQNKGDLDISEIEVTLLRPEVTLGNLLGSLREYLGNWVDK